MIYKYFIQPQINGTNQSLIGYELLMKYAEGGNWRTPVSFASIPISVITAELRATTHQVALKVPSVSVNLNHTQVLNQDILTALIDVQNHIRPVQLVVEMTEELTDAAVSSEQLLPVIQQYTAYGLEVSLDDVGTGLNTLEHLSVFLPVASELKFALQNSPNGLRDSNVRQELLSWRDLAIQHNLRFILEGIETAEDDRLATELNIPLRQGYYYGKPHLLTTN
ncbi:EAL domain-containing protein [uncultured Secundilactobacillus sp.]|uniref:EAL domain-containing protein n=1 Tax=uncultured Secundilactobacillus sp. TaxID=2813935 RepID=UPI00259074F1|nr:EAL domain-containing protein [uncultured Secundilactobacillus sp.]